MICNFANRTKQTIMATVTFFLDKRKAEETFPLKLRITHGRGKTSLISLGIKLREDQWDGERIINHPRAKSFTTFIEARRHHAESIITRLFVNGALNEFSASDLKKIIENNGVKPVEDDNKQGNFLRMFRACMESKDKANTRSSYNQTINSMQKYDPLLDTRSFEDIDVRYLESYDKWMSQQGIRQNSRNVYFRNIRTVFNRAIDDEITTAYPFRKFKLKKQATRKRSLTIDELRLLRDYPCEEWQKKYVDLFFLMFSLKSETL